MVTRTAHDAYEDCRTPEQEVPAKPLNYVWGAAHVSAAPLNDATETPPKNTAPARRFASVASRIKVKLKWLREGEGAVFDLPTERPANVRCVVKFAI